MRSIYIFLAAAVICVASGSPTEIDRNALAVVLRQDGVDIIENTRRLIEDLVANLQKAATEALEAVANFKDGLLEQAKLIEDKIIEEISKLRDRVENALKAAYDKFVDAGEAVKTCIYSHRGQAETILNTTMKDSMICADERIKEIGDQMDGLTSLANNASDFASSAMDEMRECIDKNQSDMLDAGSCLGTVALKLEVRGAVFVTQSGLQIARLNLALATLPAALEVCAGSQLVQAGFSTAKIIMEIGSCSASSIFSSLFGSPSP